MAHPEITAINGSNGVPEVLSYLNTVTDSWFSNMFLITIFVVFTMAYWRSTKDLWGATAIGGFATFIMGLLFFMMSFIDGMTFGIVIGFMVLFTAILLLTNKN